MYVSNLVLEVTRRCNMRCAHCLRGAAQRLDMSRPIIHEVFNQIDSVSIFTITGGEPSLVPDVLESIRQELIWKKSSIGSFYIVNNGLPIRHRTRYIEFLSWLHDYCDEKDCCSLEVSQDQYHRYEWPNERPNLYQFETEWGEDLPFFHRTARTREILKVLSEGRAIENEIGTEPPETQEKWRISSNYTGDDWSVDEEEVYISANGDVTSCCNMSYRRISKERIGNILQEPLKDILKRNCEMEIPEEVEAA